MKTLVSLLLIVLGIGSVTATVSHGDTLTEIRKKGVLVAGVRNSMPPFGFVDKQSGQIVGYDIDYVTAIARELGVKVKLVPVTPANRTALLQRGDIDIIAAAMTKTAGRSESVDFSLTYFLTGQQFLARKGTIGRIADLGGKTVGVVKGTTAGELLKNALPTVIIRSYDRYSQAIGALERGEIIALSTDGILLHGILSELPDKDRYEIPAVQISGDTYGLGMRKGDKRFMEFINTTLLALENSGEADRIFDKWLGPGTIYNMQKRFNRK